MAHLSNSLVLKYDLSWIPLNNIAAGDILLGADTLPKIVKKVDVYKLNYKRVFTFQDFPQIRFTEIDALWAVNFTKQWWWVENAAALQFMWGSLGIKPYGLKIIDSMLVNYKVRFANLHGWSFRELVDVTDQYSEDTETIFVYTDDYSPIIINGHIANTGLNEYVYDYTQFDWNRYQPLIKEKLIEKNQLVFPHR